MNDSLIYLASPYTHIDKNVVEQRFHDVCIACAKLMNLGIYIYSPIAHTHPVAMVGNLPTDWEFWKTYDTKMLSACDELWVLTLDGWEQSKGVKAEQEIMSSFNKPIWQINMENISDDKCIVHQTHPEYGFMTVEFNKCR